MSCEAPVSGPPWEAPLNYFISKNASGEHGCALRSRISWKSCLGLLGFLRISRFSTRPFYKETGVLGGPRKSQEVLGSPRKS